MNPNFEKFLDQFNQHALRPIIAAGKEKLDKTLSSLSSSDFRRAAEEALNMMGRNNDIDALIDRLDASAIGRSIDTMKDKLQDPQISLQVAQLLKQFAENTPPEKIEDLVFKSVEKAPLEQQFAAQILLAQMMPLLEEIKSASVEDVAAQVRMVADNLSGYQIGEEIKQLIKMGAKQLGDQSLGMASKALPSADELADAARLIGETASDALGRAANSSSFAETLAILKEFAENADIIARTLDAKTSDGQQAPKSPAAEEPAKDASVAKKFSTKSAPATEKPSTRKFSTRKPAAPVAKKPVVKKITTKPAAPKVAAPKKAAPKKGKNGPKNG